ncbi:MAG: hypothetical protein RLZZ142_1316 [Verrucomicrobiota bacterium]
MPPASRFLRSLAPLLLHAPLAAGALTMSSASAAPPASIQLQGLRFPLGERSGENPPARASIAQVLPTNAKRGIFRVSFVPVLLAQGVEIQFLRPEISALRTFPETLKALAKTDTFEMRALSLVGPGKDGPKLFAQEAFVVSADEWSLKRVQIRGERAVAECRLVLKEGAEGGLFLPGGERLSLEALLR